MVRTSSAVPAARASAAVACSVARSWRRDVDLAGAAVDGQPRCSLRHRQDPAHADHGGDAERPGEDGGVARGGAGLGDDAGDQVPRDLGGL